MNTPSKSIAPDKKRVGSQRLYFLDLGAGRVLSANTDGSDLRTLVNEGRKLPDGLAIDVEAGHLYWTNMGNRRRTTDRSSVPISTAQTSRRSSHRAARSRRSRSSSTRGIASFTGPIAKACA